MNANNLTSTKEVLEAYKKYVIQQARSNLSKSNKNVSKKLYNEIKGEILFEDNYFLLGFSMPDYGFYQDEGVKGADPTQVSKNAKIKGQQAPNSRFKFKTKRPPSKPLEQWAKSKNIRLRDNKGKFTKGNYKSIGIIIAKNIWARGIKPSLFFTKPFEAGYKKYIDTDLIKAFGDDIETLIDYTLTTK
jgi:hypothetical protein